ncbi:MAG: hypothetical protein PHF37_09470 [Phycisphaerae bacterium]|nr:hypothetical protein [Phycisphaerae bacterium]
MLTKKIIWVILTTILFSLGSSIAYARPDRHGGYRFRGGHDRVVVSPYRHHYRPVVIVRPHHYGYVRPYRRVFIAPTIVFTSSSYSYSSAPARKVEVVEDRTVTVWITNDNGTQTVVMLTKSGEGFIGPAGEYYATMPTEEQLKVICDK